MNKRFPPAFLLLLSVLLYSTLQAATVDTANVYSASMRKNIRAVVILPDGYAAGKDYPVVYLLHGFGDDHSGWITKVPSIKADVDLYRFIVVCPDASRSWYFDSPVDSSFRYETFVAKELVQWTDSRYKTKPVRSSRAITGLSMGGHGGLFLSIRHQDVFGAGGSISGGVDIRPFPNNWDLAKRLGSYAQNPQAWEQLTVVNQLHRLTPNSLSLIIDCGTEDFFYGVNEQLHKELLYRNIPHEYTTRPGGHNWDYFGKSVHFHFLFLHRFFTGATR